MLLLVLTGCGADTAEQAKSEEKADITYSLDDFCIYAEPENNFSRPVVWIGMDVNDIDDTDEYMPCFDDSDFLYADALSQEGTPTQVLKFINYKGGIRKCVRTTKGVYTTGAYPSKEKPSSTDSEVIERYGLDPENEQVIFDKTDDKNYNITLYFTEDENGGITRKIYRPDSETSPALDKEVDYILRFIITDGSVCGIQMMHK